MSSDTTPAVEMAATTRVGTARAGGFVVTAEFGAGAGVTALFGPSGAGKSVTLATIAGLLRPSAGTVTVDGVVVADAATGHHVPTQERRLGMVFQDAALLPHRSPLDNVALAVRDTPGRSARRAKARDWLGRVHADHLVEAATASLSGGEQQRIALARALAGSPRLLLLDEPFSALDRSTRQALRALVRELVHAEALTALVVTHDLDDITALADRVVRFEPGRTVDTRPLAPDGSTDLLDVLGLGAPGRDDDESDMR
ncbi:MAG: ATP-binding cassette domain-containing protein [Ilumatobacteraceae bacterium]